QIIGKRIAFIGSINDNILVSTEMAGDLLEFLYDNYRDYLAGYYGVELVEDKYENLKTIALKRGCLVKVGEPDYERAARLIVDDFRSVKIGRISLERPEE
ncbi:MAG: ribosome biogenesis GTPase YlqF, partial [Lachnospiraceae bacterium]|nr:ribosome biogenesis GTPase YlqF [Lachnospiraceae bacterium]